MTVAVLRGLSESLLVVVGHVAASCVVITCLIDLTEHAAELAAALTHKPDTLVWRTAFLGDVLTCGVVLTRTLFACQAYNAIHREYVICN